MRRRLVPDHGRQAGRLDPPDGASRRRPGRGRRRLKSAIFRPEWTGWGAVLRLFINSGPKSTSHSFLTGLNEAFRDCDGDIAARALDTGRRGSIIIVVRCGRRVTKGKTR